MTDNGGFKIDGVPASTYGVTLAYAPGQPMLPGTRDRTIEIPGRAGLYWFDSDAAALDALIRVFARVLVHVYGRPRSLELEFDDSPGLKYLVRYNGQIPFDRAWCGCSEFTLDLIADDPYAYEPEDATTINITTSGSVPGTAISSSGNIETPAEFCFTNNGANPVVGFTVKVNYEVT
jgi:phage-related protein